MATHQDFIDDGGIVNFQVEGSKIRFEINVEASEGEDAESEDIEGEELEADQQTAKRGRTSRKRPAA